MSCVSGVKKEIIGNQQVSGPRLDENTDYSDTAILEKQTCHAKDDCVVSISFMFYLFE